MKLLFKCNKVMIRKSRFTLNLCTFRLSKKDHLNNNKRIIYRERIVYYNDLNLFKKINDLVKNCYNMAKFYN